MGCFTMCTLLVAVIAALIGTGLLPQAAVQLGKKMDYEFLTGMTPIFMTEEELSAAPFSEIPQASLDGKTCLVTGGNAGIGFVTAEQLAIKGCNTVLAGRREAAIKEACTKVTKEIKQAKSKGSCTPMVVDQASLKSVRAFTKAFLKSNDRLDITVFNAGINSAFTHDETVESEDGIELNFAVNQVAHFAMYKDFEDLIAKTGREQGEARVVVVSSAVMFMPAPKVGVHTTLEGLKSVTPMQAYGQSKLANLLFAQSIAKRLAKDNVYANSVHPGTVKTEIYKPFFNRVTAWGKQGEYHTKVADAALNAIQWVMKKAFFTAEQGARAQVWLAGAPVIAEKKISGKYFHPFNNEVKPTEFATTHKVDGKLLEDALWDFCEELLKGK
mmetsp:Transcript_13547/g.24123  ORF Transcript_13547/g.24123 Transcript_13547/m.24123 type:complete len:385 (+) Transcript_13547:94-1248(+)